MLRINEILNFVVIYIYIWKILHNLPKEMFRYKDLFNIDHKHHRKPVNSPTIYELWLIEGCEPKKSNYRSEIDSLRDLTNRLSEAIVKLVYNLLLTSSMFHFVSSKGVDEVGNVIFICFYCVCN